MASETRSRSYNYSLDQLEDCPSGSERAIQYAVYGLCLDGEYHKQWCLEQVLESLGVDLRELRVALREQFPNECVDWDAGVAP